MRLRHGCATANTAPCNRGKAMAAPKKEAEDDAAEAAPDKSKGGRKKLILLAIPLLIGGIGAGLWFSGVLPRALGLTKQKDPATLALEAAEAAIAASKPIYVDFPEMIANLNNGRRQAFIKMKGKIEISKIDDGPALNAAMPRIVDLFQTYLREMSPEELRGAAGTYRLREELIARASIAAAPAKIIDVLFSEMLIQ
jgi:flagellar FliL protein